MAHDSTPPPLERLRRIARRVPGAMALGRGLRRLADPDLRTIERLRRNRGDTLFQPFPTTSEDRYPELFAALAERLAAIGRPRILSFGCADGSEVRSLRRWFPDAEITGIDINPRAIGHARRLLERAPDPAVRFICAADAGAEPAGSYDAVLAMAVFRHGELERDVPESCAAILPFSRFAAGVAMLDRVLRPGGWLALWNAHYRFADTMTAQGYDAETLPFAEAEPQVLLYGPDDRRLDADYAYVLFRKPPQGT